ncbi:MAG TPA: AAA family ATPase [Kofleriaceae bacterium]|nr:AAA family ATPase [Kofleriaceae bacterium]
MGSALSDFFDAANRIAASTGFDAIDLGAIWREAVDGSSVLLALRGVLCRSGPSKVEPFDAGPLHARRLCLGQEHWELLERELSLSRLDLNGLLQVGEFGISKHPITWSYSSRTGVRGVDGPVTRASAFGSSRSDLLGAEVYYSLTPLIAKYSDYEIASFSRLAQRFIGDTLEQGSGIEIELLAPWPVRDISIERSGPSLRLLITGPQGLNTESLIVNIESTAGDRRLRPEEIKWLTGSRDDISQYVATIDDPAYSCLAVNVYFRGVEEVHHRAKLRSGRIERDLVEPPRSRRHVPLPAEPGGQIVHLHVERFRGLRDVQLDLRDLRVLIGANQAGKSTVLDALAFLREAAAGSLYDATFRKRGGFRQVLWRGDGPAVMRFEVDVVHAERTFRYGFALGLAGPYDYIVEREVLYEWRDEQWQLLVSAAGGVAVVDGIEERTDDPRELLLPSLRSRVHAEVLRAVTSTLASISVFPGFQTGASWVDPSRAEIRQPARIQPGARLEPLAGNLTAVLHALSQSHPKQWDEFIEVTRLVFPKLERITFPPAEADRIQLAWHEEGMSGPFYAVDLSDGTLHFLAALCALYQAQSSSLIAIDEPETHLHPEALYRWVGIASKTAAEVPVLLATQSTQLLGYIDDTPEAVVVLRRDAGGTVIVRPDKEELAEWVRRFSLADLRHELESWGQST